MGFARRYQADPYRGYGLSVRRVLERIAEGVPWHASARESHGGTGSMGNGGAMRVAPLGAYFAEDFGEVVAQARASAEVTHAHPEGQAGAIAVAVAAAWSGTRGTGPAPPRPRGCSPPCWSTPPQVRPGRVWSEPRLWVSISRSGRRRPSWVTGTGSRRLTRSRSLSGVPPATSTTSPSALGDRLGRGRQRHELRHRRRDRRAGQRHRVDPGGLAECS